MRRQDAQPYDPSHQEPSFGNSLAQTSIIQTLLGFSFRTGSTRVLEHEVDCTFAESYADRHDGEP